MEDKSSQYIVNKKSKILYLEKIVSPIITITTGVGLGILMHRYREPITAFPNGQANPIIIGNLFNWSLKNAIYSHKSETPINTKSNIQSDGKNIIIFNTAMIAGYGLSALYDYLTPYFSK
jgi:hypothetical protein